MNRGQIFLESSISVFFHRTGRNARQPASKDKSETRSWVSGAGNYILKYVWGLTVDLAFSDVNTILD